MLHSVHQNLMERLHHLLSRIPGHLRAQFLSEGHQAFRRQQAAVCANRDPSRPGRHNFNPVSPLAIRCRLLRQTCNDSWIEGDVQHHGTAPQRRVTSSGVVCEASTMRISPRSRTRRICLQQHKVSSIGVSGLVMQSHSERLQSQSLQRFPIGPAAYSRGTLARQGVADRMGNRIIRSNDKDPAHEVALAVK